MLEQIEAKAGWSGCFHSFKAALLEYLKQRPTFPVTSISLPVCQAIALVAGTMHRAAGTGTSLTGATLTVHRAMWGSYFPRISTFKSTSCQLNRPDVILFHVNLAHEAPQCAICISW